MSHAYFLAAEGELQGTESKRNLGANNTECASLFALSSWSLHQLLLISMFSVIDILGSVKMVRNFIRVF